MEAIQQVLPIVLDCRGADQVRATGPYVASSRLRIPGRSARIGHG